MLRKLTLIGIVQLLLFNLTNVTNVAYAGTKHEQTLNQIMAQIAEQMQDAYPIIVTEQALSSQDVQLLRTRISKLLTLFQQAKPYISQKSETYQVSYNLILQNLQKTQLALKDANSVHSRQQLHSLGAICISCHTQDTRLRTVFEGAPRGKFASDFAYAEFSYMTRNYNDAVKYYDKYLRSDAVKTELDIIKSLQRLITIHTQVFNSPAIAAKQLAEYKKLAAHTEKTRKHLDGWISGLKTLHQRHPEDIEQHTFSQLESYVKLYIGDTDQAGAEFFSTAEDEVSRVWLRGVLFHYLNANPTADQVPKILYWLSICDRTLDYSFNFPFADLYLKECIINHSNHEYAKRCYREYEEFIAVSYSGSGGSFVPPEIEDELHDLKKYINNK